MGYLLPYDTEESPYQNDKASRQRASQQSSYLPWEYGAFSLFPLFIIFFSFSLFSQYRTLFFIKRMLHRQLIMVTLQVSTMSAWIRPAAQAFLYHIYITPWTYKLPFHFTLTTSIYKRA